LKSQVKRILSGGLKAIRARQAQLEARRARLHDEIRNVERQIAQLKADLEKAFRDGLKELSIGAPVPVSRGRKAAAAARPGGLTQKEWLKDLLGKRGPMASGQIYGEARKAGINLKSLAPILNKMAKAGEVKSKDLPGRKGKLYSRA